MASFGRGAIVLRQNPSPWSSFLGGLGQGISRSVTGIVEETKRKKEITTQLLSDIAMGKIDPRFFATPMGENYLQSLGIYDRDEMQNLVQNAKEYAVGQQPEVGPPERYTHQSFLDDLQGEAEATKARGLAGELTHLEEKEKLKSGIKVEEEAEIGKIETGEIIKQKEAAHQNTLALEFMKETLGHSAYRDTSKPTPTPEEIANNTLKIYNKLFKGGLKPASINVSGTRTVFDTGEKGKTRFDKFRGYVEEAQGLEANFKTLMGAFKAGAKKDEIELLGETLSSNIGTRFTRLVDPLKKLLTGDRFADMRTKEKERMVAIQTRRIGKRINDFLQKEGKLAGMKKEEIPTFDTKELISIITTSRAKKDLSSLPGGTWLEAGAKKADKIIAPVKPEDTTVDNPEFETQVEELAQRMVLERKGSAELGRAFTIEEAREVAREMVEAVYKQK